MPYSRTQQDKEIRLIPLRANEFKDWLDSADPGQRAWLESTGFKAGPGDWRALPGTDGRLETVVFGLQNTGWLYQLAALPAALPEAQYTVQCQWSKEQRVQAAVGWGLGSYQFERYKKRSKPSSTLFLDTDIADEVESLFHAQCMVRDLVNTPTEDMGPAQLTQALIEQADEFGAETSVILGDDLLNQNYPAIHAVGRAAEQAPRLARVQWGNPADPALILIGKGVCFDTGGLNMKSSAGMGLMKKDMGGAAHVIALARLVMQAELPVRLTVLIPAVENSIAGNAYRPGDVINTRKGLSVEIGNTDAEGRLVLCDALAEAMESMPDLVIDFATLTGAARVALGPDLPPVFSNSEAVTKGLIAAGTECEDPLWSLPLHAPYREMLNSDIATINNAGKGGFAGAITAALFLQEFVDPDIAWAHIDTFAWSPTARSGRPVGGDALGLRATFRYLQSRYT